MSEDPIPVDPGPGDAAPNGDETPRRPDALAKLWARVVELEREARWLSAKCDHLRHSCRARLDAVDSPGPLTEEQVRLVRTDAPQQSEADAVEELIRLRKERAAGPPPIPPGSTTEQLARRIAELELTVAVLAARREELRPIFLALADALEPFTPPTEQEIAEMLRAADGPPGPSILDIIAEFEAEARS
jgi:hypothetical protein